MERIIVAFQNGHAARQVRDVVEAAGVAGCILCPTAAAVRRTLLTQHVPGVVCGFKFPDGTAEELWMDLPDGCGMLVLASPAQLELCSREGMLRLATPMKRRELVASVQMLTALGRRTAEPPAAARHSEEEQRLIWEAKELLMERHGMTEELAHRFLQKQSMDLGMKMSQTARLVLGRW